jgi:hypothetical protein
LGISNDPQGIIAEYLFDGDYDQLFSIFSNLAYQLPYSKLYETCVDDHRIKHCIVWDPELQSNPSTPKDRLDAVTRNLKYQKVKELIKSIQILAEDITPRIPGSESLQTLPSFALGERAERATLLLFSNFSRQVVATVRTQPWGAAVYQDNLTARVYIGGGISRGFRQPGKELPCRPETFIQLSLPVIRTGIDQPQLPINQLPFPTAIPRELPGMPPQPPANFLANLLNALAGPPAPPNAAAPQPAAANAPVVNPPGRLTLVGRHIVQFFQNHGEGMAGTAAFAAIWGGLSVSYMSMSFTGGLIFGTMLANAAVAAVVFSSALLLLANQFPRAATLTTALVVHTALWAGIGRSIEAGVVVTAFVSGTAIVSFVFAKVMKSGLTTLYRMVRA